MVIVVVAVVAVVGWLRPMQDNRRATPPAPTYTDQQVANAKTNVCAAFGKIDHAVALSDAEAARSTDRAAQLAAAALGRQVLDFGSRYLFAQVAENPAAPSALTLAVKEQANALQDLLVGYINGAPPGDPSLQSPQKASDESADTIRRLCK